MITQKRHLNQNQSLAIVLIAIGAIIFLVNMGFVSWLTTLQILQLWPVALIVIGMDVWTKGRYRLAVILGALAIGTGLYLTNGSLGSARATTETIEQALENASRATVTLSTGVSELRVKGIEDSTHLISGKVDLVAGERALQQFSKTGENAIYNLSSELPGRVMNMQHRLWDLALTTQIPVSLRVDGGVGRMTLDLADMHLIDIQVNTGVGETRLTLASGNYSVEVNTGVGATMIDLPDDTAIRIEVEKGLGALRIQGDFNVQEDVYTSPDYMSAEERIDLKVRGGVGAITIE